MDPILGEGLVRGIQRLYDRLHDSHTAPDEPIPSHGVQYHHELVSPGGVLEQE